MPRRSGSNYTSYAYKPLPAKYIKCSFCHVSKNRAAFSKCQKKKFHSRCKSCIKEKKQGPNCWITCSKSSNKTTINTHFISWNQHEFIRITNNIAIYNIYNLISNEWQTISDCNNETHRIINHKSVPSSIFKSNLSYQLLKQLAHIHNKSIDNVILMFINIMNQCPIKQFEPQWIFSKSQNILLAIGGTKEIYLYSFAQNIWNLWAISLIRSLSNFGVVLTFDEKHIIILGGQTDESNGYHNTAEIQIIDIISKTVRKSILSCPAKAKYRAVLMDNLFENKLLIDGYVRDSLMKKNNEIAIIPNDVVNMIVSYYDVCGCIHLFTINGKQYFKMQISRILQLKS